ncbi:MAG: Jag N-terminal domain-containing protein [Deltaproteobacteria bacterium]|nr:Jag N-terminal domain-containing protein [Deltaproteobacteria bacterium]MBW1938931.1 Jag N-terminal domain-containing protein [Deltaproteobacteria bacterium]MBW1965009.1 Jag N-terminal domain-containing protein [Deltaproteobacteria bacterium]MBW2079475.1 Jag N-terminal domain-containing protein [Deltaproteobacteria bacterium]
MTHNESSALTQGSKEFDGKTVDHAIESACKYFETKPDDLEINILTRGSTGIFGLGGRKAKIHAILKEVTFPVAEKKSEEENTQIEAEANRSAPEAPETEKDLINPGKDVPEDLDKNISLAQEITEELLNKAGLAGQVEIKADEEGPYLDISGEDLSLIIGKEGQNLNALEYIVNRILRHRVGSHTGVKLEAQGYREKREKSITLLAHRMAKKAQKTGRPVILQPLGARERRLVHLTLKGVKGIRTHSVGEGIMRKVVINPARPRQRNTKNNSA